MKPTTRTHIVVAAMLLAGPPALLAHEGHGIAGPHWHASDLWGLALVLALLAAAVWLTRGR